MRDFEIIVANNNPDADVPAFVTLPPNARVIHVVEPGSYAARNAAIAEARSSVLAFTDSDCRPSPGWLAAGLSAIESAGSIDRVAGSIDVFPAQEQWTIPELYDRLFHLRQQNFVEQEGFGATANLFVSRVAFDVAGMFRGDVFSGDDRGWNLRARAKGSKVIYCPEAQVRHAARATFDALAKKRRRLTGSVYHLQSQRARRRRFLHLPVHYLLPPSKRRMKPILDMPGLAARQRRSLKWLHYRLGLVALVEILRLHYLNGIPRRS
jgi:GT2 family glycosyltransferase